MKYQWVYKKEADINSKAIGFTIHLMFLNKKHLKFDQAWMFLFCPSQIEARTRKSVGGKKSRNT